MTMGEDSVQIIIVDDEPISADEMGDLIRQEYVGRPVGVRVAYNAQTALRMAEQEPCDILISDIQMPGMTGLELAQRMRQKKPDICILYLTGYDDFSYAYEAFRQNADSYLLKTEGDEVILGAVRKAVERLAERRRIVANIHEVKTRYDQMVPAYRRELLLNCLISNDNADAEPDFQNLYMVMARFDDSGSAVPLRSKMIALSAVEKIIADSLTYPLNWIESFLVDTELIWILSVNREDDCRNVLFQIARKARCHLDEQLSLHLFFIVADQAVPLKELNSKFSEIHNMFTREILHDAEGAAIRHIESREPTARCEDDLLLISRLRRELEVCVRDVRDGAFDALQSHSAELMHYVMEHTQEACSAEFVAVLTGALLSYANFNQLDSVIAEADSFAMRFTPTYMVKLIDGMAREGKKQVDDAMWTIVRFILTYIHDHISGDISASALAEASGYSTGYLARIFKQQEGVSIHDYVTMERMSLARELLCNTNLRVYEIASSCGYDNTAYFIKVFKNDTGQTPQEYKQENAGRRQRNG